VFAPIRMDNAAVPAVLCGFGAWARNRTVMPLLDEDPDAMRLAAITELQGGRHEYERDVVPAFSDRQLEPPPYVHSWDEAVELLCDAQVAAALICTPNALHDSAIAKALSAGLHTYVERPAVGPDDDPLSLVRTANERGLHLFTGVQRRLEAPYRYLMDAIRSASSGVDSIHCQMAVGHQIKGWRSDPQLAPGGILMDSGFHLLDLSAWLLAADEEDCEEVAHVSALLRGLPGEPPSEAVGFVELASRKLLTFDFSYRVPAGSVIERLEVHLRNGDRLAVQREQPHRSTKPGTVTHQLADGPLATACLNTATEVLVEGVGLRGEAANTGPLKDFLRSIAESPDASNVDHCCSVAQFVPTWRLARHILMAAYRTEVGVH